MATLTALKVVGDSGALAAPASSMDSGTLTTGCTTLMALAIWGNRTNNSSVFLRFNADAGAHYAWRCSELAAAYGSTNAGGTNQAYVTSDGGVGEGSLMATINNLTFGGSSTAYVTTIPYVSGFNFNDTITSIQLHASAGNFPIGSRLIVLGV